jgi:NitT/TauT family transport system ATP-binding protein
MTTEDHSPSNSGERGANTSKLSFRGVTMVFSTDHGPVTALQDVSLDVAPGEFVCIVGASGGGKSTLLHIAAGLQQQTAGEVLIDGKTVEGPGPDRAVIFQEDAVFPWSRVAQNVEYGLKAQRVPADDRRQRVEQMIKLVGLEGWEGAYPRQLSGGMRKRVDVARAFASQPEVILMDEPFGGLDAVTKETLQTEVLRIWDSEHKTILFVTHDLEEAVFLADRIVLLRRGEAPRIYANELPRPRTSELRTSHELQERRGELSRLLAERDEDWESVT